jgi:hypothetical protein
LQWTRPPSFSISYLLSRRVVSKVPVNNARGKSPAFTIACSEAAAL